MNRQPYKRYGDAFRSREFSKIPVQYGKMESPACIYGDEPLDDAHHSIPVISSGLTAAAIEFVKVKTAHNNMSMSVKC